MFNAELIYKRVDEMRLQRGWSHYRLAELANISMTSIYSWRDRKSLPTLTTLNAVAEAFGVDPIVFLVGEEGLAARDAEEQELLTRWNALTTEQKASLMGMLRSFTANHD